MTISDIKAETQDFDRFSVDVKGEIAHFASGGRGFLAPTVMAAKEELQSLTACVRHAMSRNGKWIESPNLSTHMHFESSEWKSWCANHQLAI
jgi:hypothetical protein